jgi:hypothetical protein
MQKFNVFKSASLVRVVEANNIMDAAEKAGLTNPKMSKYENVVCSGSKMVNNRLPSKFASRNNFSSASIGGVGCWR